MACGTADCSLARTEAPTAARSWRAAIAAWAAARRERRALARLDARLLADIGLTEEDAAREAARPFWDLPNRLRQP